MPKPQTLINPISVTPEIMDGIYLAADLISLYDMARALGRPLPVGEKEDEATAMIGDLAGQAAGDFVRIMLQIYDVDPRSAKDLAQEIELRCE